MSFYFILFIYLFIFKFINFIKCIIFIIFIFFLFFYFYFYYYYFLFFIFFLFYLLYIKYYILFFLFYLIDIFKSGSENVEIKPIEIKEEPVEVKEEIDLELLGKKIKVEEESDNEAEISVNEEVVDQNREERERIEKEEKERAEKERAEREKIVKNLPDVDINDYQLDNDNDLEENGEGGELSTTALSATASRQTRPQRKRKIILYDDQIELLGEQISSQLKNPSNTLVKVI